MRTFATLFTVGALVAATLAQNLLPFDKNLKCEACAIGGYRFVWNNNNDAVCCDAVNNPSCLVSSNYRFSTSEDKFTAVYTDCNRANFRDFNVCGTPAVR